MAILEDLFSSHGFYSTVSPPFSIDVVKTAMFLEARSKSTVHRTGARTLSFIGSDTNNSRLTALQSVACDGTKLYLFLFIIKADKSYAIKGNLKFYYHKIFLASVKKYESKYTFFEGIK